MEEIYYYLDELKDIYNIKEIEQKKIEKFAIISEYNNYQSVATFAFKKREHLINLLFVQIPYESSYNRLSSNLSRIDNSIYIFGYFEILFNGYLIVSPKTLAEKLIFFFSNKLKTSNIDFEKNYNIVSSNVSIKQIPFNLLDIFIRNGKTIELEILNEECIYRLNREPLNKQNIKSTLIAGFELLNELS